MSRVEQHSSSTTVTSQCFAKFDRWIDKEIPVLGPTSRSIVADLVGETRDTEGRYVRILIHPEIQATLDPEHLLAWDFDLFLFQPKDCPGDAVARDAALEAAIAYVMAHPRWKLSLQTHKLLGLP